MKNDIVIIEEADGSLTVNVNGGEITINGENDDQKRQEITEPND